MPDIPPLSLSGLLHLQLGIGMLEWEDTICRNRFSQLALVSGMLQILDLRICQKESSLKLTYRNNDTNVPRTFIMMCTAVHSSAFIERHVII